MPAELVEPSCLEILLALQRQVYEYELERANSRDLRLSPMISTTDTRALRPPQVHALRPNLYVRVRWSLVRRRQ